MAADDLFAQAGAQAGAGRFAEALATLDALIAETPGDARAWSMQGSLRMELGRPGDALASYDRALTLNPAAAATLVNRGNALSLLGRHAEAVESYDRALALDPRLVPAHGNRARALIALERSAEALASADAALALQPAYANAWTHRGSALHALERYDEALDAFQKARAAGADPHEAQSNLGMTLTALGRYREALAPLDAAVALRPEAPLARYRRSRPRLTLGDFQGGWADYEHRWRTAFFAARSAGYVTAAAQAKLAANPRPEDLAGRRVLVLAEQGVGDQIMFASILPDLAAAAARVTLVCDPRLVGLFAHSFPGVAVQGPDGATERGEGDFDVVLALGSLAVVYRNTEADFPGRPYLAPRPELTESWRERLGPANGRRRIGISWRGGGPTTGSAARSLTLAALRPIVDTPDCEFVSLQYGDPRAEVAEVNAGLSRPIRCFDPAEIDDFEALAGLVSALDVVVSVQTAVIHLSGALGRPCLVMVPQTPEWRYMVGRPAIPWYGSVRLFRQEGGVGWSPVIDRVAAALAAGAG